MERPDLSGWWSGAYNYPDGSPPNAFRAELRDDGGRLSGLTSEVDDEPGAAPSPIYATLTGGHGDQIVWFTKVYDDLGRAEHPIFYEGLLDTTANEICGTWHIVGDRTGGFTMRRDAANDSACAVDRSESVS